MPEVRQYIVTAILLVVLVVSAGCSDSTGGRMEVSGTVKLKGRPIPNGATIQFVPLENQGTEGQATASDGKFSIAKVNGLKPGKYLVRMTAGDGKTAVNPANPNEPPGPAGGTNIVSKDLVPPDWGINSKQQVTVKATDPNTFDFDIP
jgi:hypothetical protein